MENKNKELALKNIQLKEEIDKLTQVQSMLLKDSIKKEYYTGKCIDKVIGVLDENICILENALARTKKIRTLIGSSSNKQIRDVLSDKNK